LFAWKSLPDDAAGNEDCRATDVGATNATAGSMTISHQAQLTHGSCEVDAVATVPTVAFGNSTVINAP
jgi:hypothetical protein